MRARIMRTRCCEDTNKRTRLPQSGDTVFYTEVDTLSRELLQLPLATRENALNPPPWHHTRLQRLLDHSGNLLR